MNSRYPFLVIAILLALSLDSTAAHVAFAQLSVS